MCSRARVLRDRVWPGSVSALRSFILVVYFPLSSYRPSRRTFPPSSQVPITPSSYLFLVVFAQFFPSHCRSFHPQSLISGRRFSFCLFSPVIPPPVISIAFLSVSFVSSRCRSSSPPRSGICLDWLLAFFLSSLSVFSLSKNTAHHNHPRAVIV